MLLIHFYQIKFSDAQDICTNVPKVTKTILDCRLLANQETFPYSLEKMKNCLQEQFLLHVANKGSTSGTLCVEAVNVINRIQNCKTSSSSTDEFKDCLFKRILELISTTDTTTTTTISPPGKNIWCIVIFSVIKSRDRRANLNILK